MHMQTHTLSHTCVNLIIDAQTPAIPVLLAIEVLVLTAAPAPPPVVAPLRAAPAPTPGLESLLAAE